MSGVCWHFLHNALDHLEIFSKSIENAINVCTISVSGIRRNSIVVQSKFYVDDHEHVL